MSKRKMLKQLASKGRMGDTELRKVKGRLSHVNPIEAEIIDRAGVKGEDIVSKIGSGTINPKTGLKEYFWGAVAAAVIGAVSSYSAAKSAQKSNEKIIKKQENLKKKQIKAELKSLEAQKQIQPLEAEAIENLREASREGTMDVDTLTQQIAQPIYQQGQMQTSEAMGQITAQGLEGSIIAQNVAARIGADTRASIAAQARSIAMANQQTREGARRQLNERMFARADMLRQIAENRRRVKAGLEALPLESEIARIQSDSAFNQSLISAGAGLASNLASIDYGAPDLDLNEFDSNSSSTLLDPTISSGYA